MRSQLENSITEALAFYNLGELGSQDTVFVFGHVMSEYSLVLPVEIFRNKRSVQCEFLRSQITVTRTSSVTALIEIPKTFVSIFRLANMVLDDHEIDRYREQAEMFNSSYLPPTRVRSTEMVGGIRI